MSSGSRKKPKRQELVIAFTLLVEDGEIIDVAWDTWKDEPKYKRKGKVLTLNPDYSA